MKKLTLKQMIDIEKKTKKPFFEYIQNIDYKSVSGIVEVYQNFFNVDFETAEKIYNEKGLEKLAEDIIEIATNTMGESKLKTVVSKKKAKK